MANQIVIELCKEDRDRLDRIGHMLEALTRDILPQTYADMKAEQPAAAAPAPAPAAEPEQAPAPEPAPAAPEISKADVQHKVIELSRAGKKEDVKKVIEVYGQKVSDVPAEKYAEVMERLNAIGV